MKKAKIFFSALLATALMPTLQAAEVTEDFESVTITDSNVWQGVHLSNGWQVVGGYIAANSADYTNYGFWSTAYDGSKRSLTAQAGSSNSAFVVITDEVSGEFCFYARKTSSSSSTSGTIKIYEVAESEDSYKTVSTIFSQTLTTTWTKYTVDLGDSPRLVAINLVRAAVDDVTYNTHEAATTPQLAVLQDDVKVATGGTYNFGLQAEDATVEYSIKNTGAGTLEATLSCTGSYSVSPAKVSLTSGEVQVVTITQSANKVGAAQGVLSVSAADNTTWTLNLRGIVRDTNHLYFDFSTTAEGWTLGEKWSVSGGSLNIGYDTQMTNRVISPAVSLSSVFPFLYFRYKASTNYSYYTSTVHVWTSADGENWKELGDGFTTTDMEWHETMLTGIPSNTKFVSFTGQYISIDDFYGFKPNTLPLLAVSKPSSVFVNEDEMEIDSYGSVLSTDKHTYTIKNVGAGSLTVNLSLNQTANYSLSATSITVAGGESQSFDVVFTADEEEADRFAILTIQPTDKKLDTVTIYLKGKSDPYAKLKNNQNLDFNGDGEFNVGDVTRLAKFLIQQNK